MKSLTSIISKVQDIKLKKLKLHIKELNKDMRKIQRDYKRISERETKDDRSRLKPDDLIRELGVKLGKHLSAEKKITAIIAAALKTYGASEIPRELLRQYGRSIFSPWKIGSLCSTWILILLTLPILYK